MVHELRYLAGHGGDAEQALADHGHAYLTFLTPLVGLLLAAAATHFVWSVRARREDRCERTGRLDTLRLAGILLAVYVGQELVEGLLASGHPDGLSGVFGDGGWTAIPLSVVVAAVLTLMSRGARRLVEGVFARAARQLFGSATAPRARPAAVTFEACASLARHGAERAPPLLAS